MSEVADGAKRKPGRPPVTDRTTLKAYPIAMRVTAMLYNALVEATLITGRSLSNEIAIRLERSFGTALIVAEHEAIERQPAVRELLSHLEGSGWEP